MIYPVNLLKCKMLDFGPRKGLSEKVNAILNKCN